MELLITIGTYILGFIAVALTIGFIIWMYLLFKILKNYKNRSKDFNKISDSFWASWNDTNDSIKNRHSHNPFKDMHK